MAALTGLPRSLIERGLLEEAQAKDIFARATKKGASFISVAVAENAVSAHDVASVASEDFGLPLFDLNAVNASETLSILSGLETSISPLIESREVSSFLKKSDGFLSGTYRLSIIIIFISYL